jgi:hypothetical protein
MAKAEITVAPESPPISTWSSRSARPPVPFRVSAKDQKDLKKLVSAYPLARIIHLVRDKLNAHCRKSLTDHLGERKGGYLGSPLRVNAPKHGSWLNQAEIELLLVSRFWEPPDLGRLNRKPGPGTSAPTCNNFASFGT